MNEINMNIRYSMLALFVLVIVCSTVLPQKTSGRAGVKRTPNTKPASPRRIPDYQINLKITDGSKYFVSIVSPDQSGRLNASDLNSLITDLPTGADGFNQPNNVFPRVVIEVTPNVSMLAFWNPITLFRRGRTEIIVPVPTGIPNEADILLAVHWKVPEPNVDVKPSPFLLIVNVADDGKLSLNNEPAGTVSNTDRLVTQLKDIFKEREDNAVFREGTNDIEKSVTIVMPMSSRKFSDLVTVAQAVWLPGGDRISLAMDDPLGGDAGGFVNDRKDLLNLPPIPPLTKKH